MSRVSTKAVALGIFLVAIVLAGIVSFYAAGSPDGLTKVAQDQGFADTETEHSTADSPFAGYGSSFLDNDRVGTGVAGVVGVLVVLGIGTGITRAVRRRPVPDDDDEDERDRADASSEA